VILCTRLLVINSHLDGAGIRIIDEAVILDVSMVDETHVFGIDPDNPDVLHIAGDVPLDNEGRVREFRDPPAGLAEAGPPL